MTLINEHECCKGCVENTYGCLYIPVSDDGICPCAECLIKSMCKTSCDEWYKYKGFHSARKQSSG